MVIALAGSRTDVPEDKIAHEIEAELRKLEATVLVSSAASGADLLALEAAGRLGIRRTVVLPFDRETFRKKCVANVPGDWGARFDAQMDQATGSGDLVVLGFDENDGSASVATDKRVLAEARTTALGLADSVAAILVWDGKPGGREDACVQFLKEAEIASVPVTRILTN